MSRRRRATLDLVLDEPFNALAYSADSIYGAGWEARNAFVQAGNGWSSDATAWPHWIAADLGAPAVVQRVRIWPRDYGGGARLKDFEVQGSPDGVTWTTVYAGQCANNAAWQEFSWSIAVPYRHWRVLGASSWDTRTSPPGYDLVMQLLGLEMYASASGGPNLARCRWIPGAGAWDNEAGYLRPGAAGNYLSAYAECEQAVGVWEFSVTWQGDENATTWSAFFAARNTVFNNNAGQATEAYSITGSRDGTTSLARYSNGANTTLLNLGSYATGLGVWHRFRVERSFGGVWSVYVDGVLRGVVVDDYWDTFSYFGFYINDAQLVAYLDDALVYNEGAVAATY